MSADKKIKQLEEETQQLEAEEAKLRKQLDELLALLAELQTHIVYAIFTALKELFYIGQTEDLDERTFNHIQVALYRSSKRNPRFYSKLAEELKTNGVFIVRVATGLNEKQADDLETGSVMHAIASDLKDFCAPEGWDVDVENGKVETVCNIRKGSKAAMKRFADLPDDEREKQLKAAYDKVIESVQTCSEKDLIRYYLLFSEDVFVLVDDSLVRFFYSDKCVVCTYVTNPDDICSREGCYIKGTGPSDYCRDCYNDHREKINAGKVPPPKKSCIRGNQLQRAIWLSFRSTTMMSCDISDLMKRALGLDFPKGTLQKWRSNYLSTFKNAENYQVLALRIRTFLKGNSKEQYTGPSREVVEALFVCGKCRKESEASCVQRLKEAFPEYADRFTLEHAQEVYARSEEIKAEYVRQIAAEKELKRQIDEDKWKKLEEDEESDAPPKKKKKGAK